MKRYILAAVLAATSAHAESFETPQRIASENIAGGWTGMAHANPEGTRWSSCSIFSSLTRPDGTSAVLSMMYFADSGLAVTISNDEWKLRKGKTYAAQYSMGGKYEWTVKATAVSADTITMTGVRVEDLDDFMAEFSYGTRFKLTINGKDAGNYSLTGSAKAVQWLDKCVEQGSAMNGVDLDKPAKPAVNPKTPKLDM
jgi:hypothetical protein